MGTNIFREYLRESEINDYFKELEEDNREYFKLLYHNSHPLLDNMNEAVIKPEMIKINPNISNLQDLNDEFKKLRVNFYNDKELHAYYNQEKDELQLTGKFKDKEGLLTGLRKYLRQVFIINPKAEFNRSEISKIEDIPFDMQTLILCE